MWEVGLSRQLRRGCGDAHELPRAAAVYVCREPARKEHGKDSEPACGSPLANCFACPATSTSIRDCGNWTEVPHALSCASPCRSCSNGTNVIPAQRHDAAGGGAAPASCTPAALAQYPDLGYHQLACAQAGEAANRGRASAHSSHRLPYHAPRHFASEFKVPHHVCSLWR